QDSTTLTLSPTITVHGQNGTIGYVSYFGGPSNVAFINQGTIQADTPGYGITLTGTGWQNTRTPPTQAGSALSAGGTWSNDGQVTGNGSFSLGGTWTDSGAINAPGASIGLGGTLTLTASPTFVLDGSTFNFVGTVNLAGNTLTLSGASGAWSLV